ncbi:MULTISPECIES: hypothetical protein [unclassified Halomonas]|uniref:hypothetical protein n=1 Tax=unclassified Halomonas TaxID=2609666 RepID=UPI0007D95CDE|nr:MULTISPECIES: hypothetical protein [unclassified Halomonas]MBT2786316.1 hypothetical protein [Halomonas sp. ISL-106]MBT2797338.1 hypothetical protein [Halomonas sp. ISL-104]OAL58709.1 hypothetical protein A6R74_07415 [Halomonas sp. ALS9]
MFEKFTLGSLYIMNQYRSAILKGIVFPFILYVLLQLARYESAYTEFTHGSAFSLLHIVLFVIDMAILSIISINTTRIILLNERPEAFKLRFNRRETKYLLYSIGFLALWIVPGMFIGASLTLITYSVFMGLIPLTFFLATLFFTLRLSLVFVGVALDKKISMRESLSMTKRCQWSLFFSLSLLIGLLFMFEYCFELVSSTIGGQTFSLITFILITPLVDTFIYVFSAIILTILYSNAYQPTSSP